MNEKGIEKRLYCIRHAKSSWDEPMLADRQRPLNKRGLRDAPEMGKRLFKKKARPGLIVVSPAERARMTARLIAGEINFPSDRIVENDSLYFCGVDAILELVRQFDNHFHTVLCVSHNPDISEFVAQMTNANIADMPTCAVAEIAVHSSSWDSIDYGFAELLELDFPKKHKNR